METRATRPFLRLLANFRWLAVLGQALTVLVVTGPMRVALPETPLWAGIGALALFNVYASWRARAGSEPGAVLVFIHILIDVLSLTWMIGWSGGVENPFSSLFLLPIALAILALPGKWVAAVAAASLAGYCISALLAQDLPHVHGVFGDTFSLHKLDGQSGAVLTRVVWNDFPTVPRFVSLGVDLHEGTFFGRANQIFNTLVALSLMWLAVTGFVGWYKRRPSGGLAAPPRREVRYPRAVLGAAAALCIVLPMLGASVLAIALLDRGLGRFLPARA